MRARILPPTPENIATAAAAVLRGEVVGMPTETVYGLAGAALMPDALALIFGTKERPTFDPLIVHVGLAAKGLFALEHLKLVDLSKMSETARARAEVLIQAFWPGPLTLVLPKHADVPELATSGLPSVALRMPAHRVAQGLLAAAGQPLAAPSANRFGRISPTTAQAVAEELGDRIDWILDGGACEIGVESTVVRIEENGALTLLRPGGLSRARIEEVAGCALQSPELRTSGTGDSGPSPAPQPAPGMLDSHYAPAKPLHLLPQAAQLLTPEQWKQVAAHGASFAFLLQKCSDLPAFEAFARTQLTQAGAAGAQVSALALSRDGDLHEAARNLFGHLRALDASAAQVLLAEPCPIDHGLGHAIADRLTRAASRNPSPHRR
jgi:L-threonylcarbamoyladenylate synthase